MSGNLCEHCTGVCCKYIALPIETPAGRADFDDIRWYLLHEHISVFVEGGQWYISMTTPCRHLGPDYRCAIYATRPAICRNYTTENCDYHSGDYGWEEHFACPEHLDEYLLARRKSSGKDNQKPEIITESKLGWPGKELAHRRKSQHRKKIKTRAARLRHPSGAKLAAASTDIAGVPLPVLGNPR